VKADRTSKTELHSGAVSTKSITGVPVTALEYVAFGKSTRRGIFGDKYTNYKVVPSLTLKTLVSFLHFCRRLTRVFLLIKII